MRHFEILGKHYGYPSCCIEWFTGRFFGANPFELTPEQDAVHNNKGFIPCPKCAEKVNSGDIDIQDLIVNREHPLPYPKEDRAYMKEHYES